MSSFTTARFSAFPLTRRLLDEESGTASAADGVADEELLAALRAGHSEALGALFQRYGKAVRSIGIRILKDLAEAEDLVQDLFLFLQKNCAVFDRTKSSAHSWIIQMAYHRAIERRRYLAVRKFYSRVEVDDRSHALVGIPTSETDYSAEAVFGRNGINKVLGALSRDQKETLRLHFFEGYTFAEIAEKLGQPVGNVRHHYYRGLDRLRKQMLPDKVRRGNGHGQ